ncbi:MAG TPA: ACT domain-containing protein, partial [Bacteroidota bacterium]|nr:ACT domain-containing protein [Bacteroidota bacterium]
HCLSAKVNGRIVSLDTPLRSGDQVEIITSKNQTPKTDWEQFVVTHKAKSQIRKWLKDEERKAVVVGREVWEKRMKKYKLHINEDELLKHIHELKIDNVKDFYLKIQREEINPDTIAAEIELRLKHPQSEKGKEAKSEGIFSRFISTARDITGGITLFGTHARFLHSYAQCCNPIPGDDIAGYLTTGEGVKIHLKTCRNFIAVAHSEPHRVVEVSWPLTNGAEYHAAIRISGEDRTGLLNEIAHSISTYNNTNIKGVKIDAKGNVFEGTLIISVKNTEHLSRVIEKIRKIKGVTRTERLVD